MGCAASKAHSGGPNDDQEGGIAGLAADHAPGPESLATKERALASAEEFLKRTSGRKLLDDYARGTLVSYGAFAKLYTYYHKTTNKKVSATASPIGKAAC